LFFIKNDGPYEVLNETTETIEENVISRIQFDWSTIDGKFSGIFSIP